MLIEFLEFLSPIRFDFGGDLFNGDIRGSIAVSFEAGLFEQASKLLKLMLPELSLEPVKASFLSASFNRESSNW